MAKRSNQPRDKITLRSTAGTGTTYTTEKNKRNHPHHLVISKYDKKARRHMEFRESL